MTSMGHFELKRLRQRAGLKQKELAPALGVKHQMVRRMEMEPSIKSAREIKPTMACLILMVLDFYDEFNELPDYEAMRKQLFKLK